jgi:hypothetical protein
MIARVKSSNWPLRGLSFFVEHPRLWWRPLLATLIAWGLIVAAAIATTMWQWPVSGIGWWSYTWRGGVAIGLGLSAALAGWLIVLPIALSLAYEQLARQCQRLAGAPAADEENIMAALVSTARVIIATLPVRLAWLVLSVGASIVGGPLGIVVGAIGIGHIGAIDAVDIALAVRGVPGHERVQALRRNAKMIHGGMLSAALLSIALGVTVVGWVLWMPGMVCGAALATLEWRRDGPMRQAQG